MPKFQNDTMWYILNSKILCWTSLWFFLKNRFRLLYLEKKLGLLCSNLIRTSILHCDNIVSLINHVFWYFNSLCPLLRSNNKRNTLNSSYFWLTWLLTNMISYRDVGKSPEVPFHRITSSYSYFEEFEFLRQFSKKQNMIKKKYQLNRNKKFVDKAQQCFAFLHIKPKFKFAVQWSWFLET